MDYITLDSLSSVLHWGCDMEVVRIEGEGDVGLLDVEIPSVDLSKCNRIREQSASQFRSSLNI